MRSISEVVEALARPVVEGLGLILWDVEYLKEGGQWYLRLYLDKEDGVSIEDCEAVSRALDPILDREDPIDDPYIFEVASAGAERALKRPSDFLAYIGHLVELRTFKPKGGAKQFLGNLVSEENGAVTIEVDGENIRFEKNEIALVRLRITI
ncbi:MAG: ribosome maturation factor RimP [Ruminococcaceae bacterium]|nr:ribosome maturation factor RimP [Oscillospiraceae bacterium]